MKNGDFFLTRLINSLLTQTFRDFEVVITKKGKMAENTNAAIRRARGELVKILYMDDYLLDENALKKMVAAFDTNPNFHWLIAGADNNQFPQWTDDIETGNNRLGSPSALMFRNDKPLLFDENMSWLLDCDLYRRMCDRHKYPIILEGAYIGIGIGDHQMTNILTEKDKQEEFNYLKKKYE